MYARLVNEFNLGFENIYSNIYFFFLMTIDNRRWNRGSHWLSFIWQLYIKWIWICSTSTRRGAPVMAMHRARLPALPAATIRPWRSARPMWASTMSRTCSRTASCSSASRSPTTRSRFSSSTLKNLNEWVHSYYFYYFFYYFCSISIIA